MWLKLAKIKIAQSLGGLGPPGGAYTQGFSLSAKFPGPRWFKAEGDGNMDEFIRSQVRYNPEYPIPIGEATDPYDDGWQIIKEMTAPFGDKDLKNIKVYPIQDGDNKEKAVLVFIDAKMNEFKIEALPLRFEDIVKELKNWQFKLVPNENGYRLMGAKKNQDGDTKGIFEINKSPATPGFYYWWRDSRTPQPSDQAHGDMSQFEWANWREGGQPGR